MRLKNKAILSVALFGLFLILILLVRVADVAAIGPANTSIGLSHLNGAVRDAIGYHAFWYYLTKFLGIAALLLAGLFAAAGLIQWIRRKKLAKVDREIICLGALYVVLGVLYVFFEKIVVNFRPIIEAGESFPEASFPSSHTLLICVIFCSAALVLDRYVEQKKLNIFLKVIFVSFSVIAVLGRMLSGVHWFTDIVGGALISAALVLAFSCALDLFLKKE